MYEPIDIATVDCGGLREAVNKAIDDIAVDVNNRSDIKNARVVSLAIQITPNVVPTDDGPKNRPGFVWTVRKSIPPTTGASRTILERDTHGTITLLADPGFPLEDDSRQQNILDIPAKKKKT